MKQTKVVVGAIIDNQDSCIYVSRRPIHKPLGGMWEFPGGKVKKDETTSQALKRELHEELGININQYQFLMRQSFFYPSQFIELYVYLVERYQGVLFAKECQIISKIKLKQLPSLVMPKANKHIVNLLEAKFSKCF